MIDLINKAGNQNDAHQLLDWGVRTVKAVPGSSPEHGLGLFAAASIAAGEIIDRACSVLITLEQATALGAMSPLGDYYFEHPRAKEDGLIVLGLASLCNHADRPNAHVRFIDNRRCGWIAELYALDDIPAGKEITYKYGGALWLDDVE